MSISLIAAVARNGVIGKKGGLPWYIPEDLKRFKQLTLGHPVLMGRKTFESVLARLGKPLPGRQNIVITGKQDFTAPPGVEVFHRLEDALAAHGAEELFVIGGGTIYQQTIDQANKLYITHVDVEIEGDVYFPHVDFSAWKKIEEEPHQGYTFAVYERKKSLE